jgi:hypothetical protein
LLLFGVVDGRQSFPFISTATSSSLAVDRPGMIMK